jgi:hypothetical protein
VPWEKILNLSYCLLRHYFLLTTHIYFQYNTDYFNNRGLPLLSSFCSLSYDRSVASSKAVLHRVPSSASSFNFQYLLDSLRPSSSYLRLLSRLPVIFIFPSILLIKIQFLQDSTPCYLVKSHRRFKVHIY